MCSSSEITSLKLFHSSVDVQVVTCVLIGLAPKMGGTSDCTRCWWVHSSPFISFLSPFSSSSSLSTSSDSSNNNSSISISINDRNGHGWHRWCPSISSSSSSRAAASPHGRCLWWNLRKQIQKRNHVSHLIFCPLLISRWKQEGKKKTEK